MCLLMAEAKGSTNSELLDAVAAIYTVFVIGNRCLANKYLERSSLRWMIDFNKT